jgi:hypothetical protein
MREFHNNIPESLDLRRRWFDNSTKLFLVLAASDHTAAAAADSLTETIKVKKSGAACSRKLARVCRWDTYSIS